ncbi:MAG: DUF5020 family protein [Candidatus Marinimicrobia bacterium]|nr:DUF5020 family protein [Candidatus Neomarinimicrobiota bacterium]
MIKKIVVALLLINAVVLAQNIQLHYEASSQREYFVTTLEMFKPDKYGSTFWFVDMEYDSPAVKGVSLGYWEIARSFSLPINIFSLTVQYNDGVANFGSLGQVWLLGVNYYLDLGFVALPIDILYRSAQNSDAPDIQITTTWFKPLLDGHIELSGFLDIWSEDTGSDGEKQLVILSEPQLWYNANEHFSIGSEIEISKNFVFGESDVQVLPTIGMRWTF